MTKIILVDKSIMVDELKKIAVEQYGDLIKAVVDVNQRIMAIGGEMHADEEQFLLEEGSSQDDLWGINIYPLQPRDSWIEFDSMINIRPRQGNRSRSVEGETLQAKIKQIVNSLIKE